MIALRGVGGFVVTGAIHQLLCMGGMTPCVLRAVKLQVEQPLFCCSFPQPDSVYQKFARFPLHTPSHSTILRLQTIPHLSSIIPKKFLHLHSTPIYQLQTALSHHDALHFCKYIPPLLLLSSRVSSSADLANSCIYRPLAPLAPLGYTVWLCWRLSFGAVAMVWSLLL